MVPIKSQDNNSWKTAWMAMKVISYNPTTVKLIVCYVCHSQFICDMTDVRRVRASLEELGMQVTSAGLEFVPRTFLSLDQDQLTAVSVLIEALNDCPDVVRVWDNIQVDSWEHFLDTWWTLNTLHVEFLTLYRRKLLSTDTLYCLLLWKWVSKGQNCCQNKIVVKKKVIFFWNAFRRLQEKFH